MFSLKLSSFRDKFDKLKVRFGLASSSTSLSANDSGAERKAAVLDGEASSRGQKRPAAQDSPTPASNSGVIAKSRAVNSNEVFQLEMDEKRSCVALKWSLNPKKEGKNPNNNDNNHNTKLPGPPRKRARVHHLSSSTANLEPQWQQHPRGGPQLKLIDDPFYELPGTPQPQYSEPELQLLQKVKMNEDQRTDEINESEEKRFDSTIKPGTSRKSGSRGKVSLEKSPKEKKDACSSQKEGTRKSHSVKSLDKVTEESGKTISGRKNLEQNMTSATENVVQKTVSSTKKDRYSIAQKNLTKDPVLYREKELKREPQEDALAKDNSREVTPQKRRKWKADYAETHDTPQSKPAMSKPLKDEMNTGEGDEELKCQTEATAGNDVGQSEYTGLQVEKLEKPTTVHEPDIEWKTLEDDGTDLPSRLINLVQKASSVTGDAEDGQFHGQIPAPASQTEAQTQSSLPDASSFQATNIPPVNQSATAYANYRDNEKTEKEEVTYTNEQGKKTDARLLQFQSLDRNELKVFNDDEKKLSDVTEEELIAAFRDLGLTIKFPDVMNKFGPRLTTIKSQVAFLELLKRHCKPKQEDGELLVTLNAS
ncbi:hypothetical protein R1sor_002259 [Riccia sorocarpa]|uniref:Uncharacterized protein n=1 Tax=Riccia sorocarpa TaxID=122646 RepID=A0ABD3H0W1_9MARC